jgi:hypothetical protein
MPTTVMDAHPARTVPITVIIAIAMITWSFAVAKLPTFVFKFFIILHSLFLFRDLYKKAGISADAPTRRFSVKEEKKS